MSQLDQINQQRGQRKSAIVGHAEVIERLLTGLLAHGNLLAEGLPWLTKTRANKALATSLESKFSRIRITPDLQPADATGTEGAVPAGRQQ